MNSTKAACVEVIIFTFNQEQLIGQAITSILEQKVNFPLRIRIHDDASTDNTVSVAKNALSSSPFEWHIFSQESNQYSKGFQFFANFVLLSESKYVAFLDGDDVWTDPLKLQKQFDLLEADEQVVICHHPFGFIRGNEVLIEDWRPQHLRGGKRPGEELAKSNFIGASTVMLRVNKLEKIQSSNFDQSPVADYPLWALTSQGGEIEEIPEFMSLYREHDSNIFAGLDPLVRQRKDLTTKAFILANIEMKHKDVWLDGLLDAASWHLEVNALKQDNYDLRAQILQEKEAYSLLFSEYNSLISSTSWKITWPMRKTVGFFRRSLKRNGQ